ncbi:hypothetical protein JW710_03090 [Candidatus Dojkabacteria bacterium]|nr:hypothetical protein [Candidatus Dojkabacteria bacterium]
MDKILKKITDFINKNRQILIIAVSVTVIVIAVIYYIIYRRQQEDTSGMYVTTLRSGTESDLDWGETDLANLYGDDQTSNIPQYVAEVYSVGHIEEILSKLGISGVNPEILSDGDLYHWSSGSTSVTYTVKTGDLIVESSTGIRLSEIEQAYVSSKNVGPYFEAFLSEYLDVDENLVYEVEDTGGNFRITGTVKLSDYRVIHSINKNEMFNVVFDEGGDLVSMAVSLAEFSKGDEDLILVSINELKSYLVYGNYPREDFISVDSSYEKECEVSDCYPEFRSEDVKNMIFDEVSIVYYFDPANPDDVLPVYELSGVGVVSDGENDFEVSVKVWANAVDPERIIIQDE